MRKEFFKWLYKEHIYYKQLFYSFSDRIMLFVGERNPL